MVSCWTQGLMETAAVTLRQRRQAGPSGAGAATANKHNKSVLGNKGWHQGILTYLDRNHSKIWGLRKIVFGGRRISLSITFPQSSHIWYFCPKGFSFSVYGNVKQYVAADFQQVNWSLVGSQALNDVPKNTIISSRRTANHQHTGP